MPADRVSAKPRQKLSQRQEEVLLLKLEGYRDSEICATLAITPRTLRAHYATLRRKFSCKETRFLIPAAHRYFSGMPLIPKKKAPLKP